MKNIYQSDIYDPIYYAYKGRYLKGRMLGNLLAGLIVAVSLLEGRHTKEVIFDTILCALAFGNYIRNIGFIIMLSKMGKRDYYVFEDDVVCPKESKVNRIWLYDETVKMSHWMTLAFGFFELYFPFLLTIIIPNIFGKIIIPLIFILGTVGIKVWCNPVKSREIKFIHGFVIHRNEYNKLCIVFRTVLFNAPFYILGFILSYQDIYAVKISCNLKIVIPLFMLGVLYHIKDDIKVYKIYKHDKGKLTFEFINRMVANYFGLNTWEEIYEQRELEKRKQEEEKRRKEEEERIKEEEARRRNEEKNLRIAEMWFFKEGERIREYKKKQEKLKELERKKEEEERLAKAKRKYEQGRISEILPEDLKKLRQQEEEKYRVEIGDSSRTTRASVKRKIE